MKGFKKSGTCFLLILICTNLLAQTYPQDYFRSPLNIPMQLVANFGELRPNHWHMGLDIRTQHRVNLPVYAAADGYIARISVEPEGFGQAVYINHPNGYTTVYGHLNAFFPALAQYVKDQQYQQQSWKISLNIPPTMFPVKKGDVIALSGSTGGSQGPHVHFEIRDTKTDKCLNPLLFNFPVPDAVSPSLLRLAIYDRSKSTYDQTPHLFALKKSGTTYALASPAIVKTGAKKISFAIGAVDRFTGYTNPNGIYSAKVLCDDVATSEFKLNNIDYDETRYLNAQIDYKSKYHGGPYVQHISPLPGEESSVYTTDADNGIISLGDETVHTINIEVKDAAQNTSRLQFKIQYDSTLSKPAEADTAEKLTPNMVNVFEKPGFELFTTDKTIYDTIAINYSQSAQPSANAISDKYTFCNAAIPVQDSITVRIKPSTNIPPEAKDRIIIKGMAGEKTYVEKATWQGDWIWAKFRQFGNYQAFIDNEPPTINAPGYGDVIDLRKSKHIVLVPKDNFGEIKSFRAELDGQWLLFTNDKGLVYIYTFDDHFTSGTHQLKVTVQDVAGNTTVKLWKVRR